MKTAIYSQLVSCSSNANVNTLAAVTKSAINKEIQSRHTNFCSDNKDTRKDMKRVYRDWYQVYRMRKPAQRMVKQAEVDTLEKIERYLAPLFYADTFCTITTSEKRAPEARAQVTSAKTGKVHYLVPIAWTVASLENAVKYCAKYYAGTEVDIETKLNDIK